MGENKLNVHQPGIIKITSLKTDATLPFKKITFKAGVKYAEIANDNQFRYDSLLLGHFVPAESLSNHFHYLERITAAYISSAKKFNNTNIELGLRLERTSAHGYTEKEDIDNRWKYTQLFPSLSVDQKLGQSHQLNFSISRRINRPTYSDLNPVRWYSDQFFYYSGNPLLQPELTWAYGLSYLLLEKYALSATYNNSGNYMNRLLVLDGDAIKSQTANLGSAKRLDITGSVPLSPVSGFDVQLLANVNRTAYPISMVSGLKQLSRWGTNFTLQNQYNLLKKWNINVNINYYTSELRGIYLTQPAWFVDVGLKRNWLNKRITTQLNCNDVFNSNRYKAFSQTDIINYYYNDKPFGRQLAVSVTWHFGGDMVKSSGRRTEEQERL